MRITVAVTAKNEESTIAACLRSLIASIEMAEAKGTSRFDLVVVLDDCNDRTEEIVNTFENVSAIPSSGGLVAAQRTVANRKPFVIFCDADILVSPETVLEITRAMLATPSLQVAYPMKNPRKPARRTALADSLYRYNANDGFETKRSHFNGKLFAIRNWSIPTPQEISERIQQLPPNNFYHFEAGVRADDIYLSKNILHLHGPKSIREIPEGQISFQAPETFEGMYRYYRRMRMELERIDLLFPEFRQAGTAKSPRKRRTDWKRLRAAGLRNQLAWLLFQIAFRACILRYHLERFYYTHLSKQPCPFWPIVTETKTFSSSAGNHPG